MTTGVQGEEERRREVLARAGLALASELSLPAVLQKIVDSACEVARARYAALGVIGPDRRIQEFVTQGISDSERARIGRPPEGGGILGVLISEAQPLRLAQISSDPRSVGFPPNHPAMTSFLGVPIAVRGRVYGNLYLTEKIGAAEFTEDDEEDVVQLATYAAVAIDNARLYSDAQLGRQRVEAVNEVTRAMLEGADDDGLMRLIARHAKELAGAAVATIVTPASEGMLVVRVAEGDHADELEGTRFPEAGSLSSEVMYERDRHLLADAASDEHVHQPLVGVGGIGPIVFVPLAVRHQAYGTLAVGNRVGGAAFTDQHLELLEAFAAQAAVALDYSRIQGELQRLLVTEERERIAKELHDDIIQSLFAEGMALQAAASMVHDPEAMRLRLEQSVDHIDRVIRDLRNYIFGLRPGAMADRQLAGALRALAASFGDPNGLTIEVETDETAVAMLAPRANDVIQASREAISNAVRHSGATLIELHLEDKGDEALLEVRDDGKGFDPETAEGRGHGLRNLRARAAALGGLLEIDSTQGRGTSVRIRIPV